MYNDAKSQGKPAGNVGIAERFLFNAPPSDELSKRYQIKTKIICTIGPKVSSVDMITKLINAGMNVARLNFSHGSHEYHLETIKNIRAACEKIGNISEVAILLDTKGPEIRTGTNKNGEIINLVEGQEFTFHNDLNKPGDQEGVATTYSHLANTVRPGDLILVDDGLVGMRVKKACLKSKTVLCVVENSGELGERKGINLPGLKVDLPAITDKDKEDIEFGIRNKVDFIAASFIRKDSDVLEIRKLIEGTGIRIISKIENREGLENFDKIYAVSDGVMVARGDLGVEIPVEQVFRYQKLAIKRCNLAGKPVITATQMLESMINNPRPTRAEATDVANAVLDGSDCVMLSGETAKGKFPIKSVEVMFNICREAECDVQYNLLYNDLRRSLQVPITVGEAIATSAVKTSWDLHATLIIIFTETGNMARYIAKHRPVAPVIAVTSSPQVARHCGVLRGVYPFLVKSMAGTEQILLCAMKWGMDNGMVHLGDQVVVTSGIVEGSTGSTNKMRVIECKCV